MLDPPGAWSDGGRVTVKHAERHTPRRGSPPCRLPTEPKAGSPDIIGALRTILKSQYHIQHHAGQLMDRLRTKAGMGVE
jgi:hypothetical protein